MRGHLERFGNLCIGTVDHRGFDRAHRRAAFAHVEDGGRAAPHDRRARPRKLMDRDSCEAFRSVLSDRSNQGDRRGSTC